MRLQYLSLVVPQPGKLNFVRPNLEQFSAPDDVTGYSDKSISDDLITEVYLDFIKLHEKEMEQFCCSTKGSFLSLLPSQPC